LSTPRCADAATIVSRETMKAAPGMIVWGWLERQFGSCYWVCIAEYSKSA
jgi:hypothetical protein